MKVRIKRQRELLTVYLCGELDHHSAESVRELIDEEVRKTKPKVLRIDFLEVDFMDSSGVGLVMGRYKNISKYGGTIELCNMGQAVSRVMKLSAIEKIAKIKE